MDILTIYHGSNKIVKKPMYGFGKPYNDYGLGFYTTLEHDLAKEWATRDGSNSIVNKYEIDTTDLKILDLNDKKYNVLHWITILIENRTFEMDFAAQDDNYNYLVANYHLNLDEYDIIIGYRADDSYYKYAREVLNNDLGIYGLKLCLIAGFLGNQVCIKSKKAFSRIKHISSEEINYDFYRKIKAFRDKEANDFHKEIKRQKFDFDLTIDDIRKGRDINGIV